MNSRFQGHWECFVPEIVADNLFNGADRKVTDRIACYALYIDPPLGRPAMPAPERHLVGCDLENARGVLSLIQGILPAVSVFFELGREPVAVSPQGLRALRLDEMTHRARLQSAEQVVACLKAIDAAVQRVSGSADAVLTVLDGSGHCLVADVTARSILALWQEIVAAHDLPHADHAPVREVPYTTATPFQAPYEISMPPFTADGQASCWRQRGSVDFC